MKSFSAAYYPVLFSKHDSLIKETDICLLWIYLFYLNFFDWNFYKITY